MNREEEIRQSLFDHTLADHAREVRALTEEALSLGMKPAGLLFETLIPALTEVGRRFETGEYFVPEMLVAAKAMQQALIILRPALGDAGQTPAGKVMMMTVKGDLHDIGKNLCNIMFEGAGFQVVDLGVNIPPEKMIAAIRQHRPDIIGFSALLTTTMPMFKANIDALANAGSHSSAAVCLARSTAPPH